MNSLILSLCLSVAAAAAPRAAAPADAHLSLPTAAWAAPQQGAAEAAAATAVLAEPAAAGESAPPPLAVASARIVTGLRATWQSLAFIGKEAGIFDKNGVDLQLLKMDVSGPEAARGLIRGDWEFTEAGAGPNVRGVLEEHDNVMLLASLQPVERDEIVLRKELTSAAQLHGARYGTLTPDGQVAMRAKAIMRELGVKDFTLVPLGTNQKVYEALARGDVDVAGLSVEYRIAGKRAHGFNTLEIKDPGFLPPVLATTRRLVAQRRDLAERMVRSFVETIELFKKDRAAVIPLLERYFEIFDRSVIEEVYDYFAPRLRSVPMPSAEGIKRLLDDFESEYPGASKRAPSEFIDTSLLEKGAER